MAQHEREIINPVIGWWSGGITSAVACKLAIEIYENVRIIFLNTKNEHDDTYRFLKDCELWYEREIEDLSNEKYNNIKEVWYKYNSLNVANGAICSSELKRDIRRKITTEREFSYQVFGFDIGEPKRAMAMKLNNPETNPVFPLLMFGYSKKDCIEIVQKAGIEIPEAYKLGFNNNNCLQTGCIQGGVGYWQKMRRGFPEKFEAMAKIEHELTDRKGVPVTMLRSKTNPVFLLPHPNYPLLADISMMKGREPKPLMECNGFCGTNDLIPNETWNELNFAD